MQRSGDAERGHDKENWQYGKDHTPQWESGNASQDCGNECDDKNDVSDITSHRACDVVKQFHHDFTGIVIASKPDENIFDQTVEDVMRSTDHNEESGGKKQDRTVYFRLSIHIDSECKISKKLKKKRKCAEDGRAERDFFRYSFQKLC